MCHIVIISPVHTTNDIRVFHKEAISLARNGFEVSIICKEVNDDTLELSKSINKYPLPKYKKRVFRFFLQPYILFKSITLKADVYLIHNPDTLIIGLLLKLFGKKVIYDTHEDFSKKILIKDWIPKILRQSIAKFVSKLEKVGYKAFDGFIVSQGSQREKFGKKTLLIENAPLLDKEIINKSYLLSKRNDRSEDLKRLVYVGGISKERGIFYMLDLLIAINKELPTRLWLIGPENNYIKEARKHIGWKYVDYRGYLPLPEAYSYIISADVGLLLLEDIADYSETSPNKLFEYNLFGKPFVATSFDNWKKNYEKVHSGKFVDLTKKDQVVTEILYLLNNKQVAIDMGKKGENFIFKKFNWTIESQKFIEIFKSYK